MIKFFSFLFLLVLSLKLNAQGIMPVPGLHSRSKYLTDDSVQCLLDQNLSILDHQQLSPFEDFAALMCNEDSLFRDSVLYKHDDAHCDQVAVCSSAINEEEMKEAEAIVKKNIPTVSYLSLLAKALKANLYYNTALMAHEKKYQIKICPEVRTERDCDQQMRTALRLIDAEGENDLQEIIQDKFFSKYGVDEIAEADLKKDCSKKFNLQNVCNEAQKRTEAVIKCDNSSLGKNCFDKEQRAWSKVMNNFKNSNKSLFLALEKQLCQPQRITKSVVDRQHQ